MHKIMGKLNYVSINCINLREVLCTLKQVTSNTEDYLEGIILDNIIGVESDYIETDRKQVAVFVLVYSGLLTLKQVTSNSEDYLYNNYTCMKL